MDPGISSPLVDYFKRGEAPREACLLAAKGAFSPHAHEQIALLVLLSDHADREIAGQANATLAALPKPALAAFLSRPDVPPTLRDFFAARGAANEAAADQSAAAADDDGKPDADGAGGEETSEDEDEEAKMLSSLPIGDRIKIAMKGTREQRAQLIRDSNKVVATAVLGSPKLTEAEVESFVKMGNVSEEVLRIIGTNRNWLKNYGVVHGLTRNPKTPPAIAMQLMHRLTEKDVKMLSTDRNVPEALRLAARRMIVKSLK
jgi:hypothetical protein